MEYQAEIGDLKMGYGTIIPPGWERISCEFVSADAVAHNLKSLEQGDRLLITCVIYVGPDYVGQRKD